MVYRKVSSVGQMKLRSVIVVCVYDVNLGSDIFNSVSYLQTETELLAQNCCILFDSLCCHCINTMLMFCWNRIMVAHIPSATQHVLQEIPMNSLPNTEYNGTYSVAIFANFFQLVPVAWKKVFLHGIRLL